MLQTSPSCPASQYSLIGRALRLCLLAASCYTHPLLAQTATQAPIQAPTQTSPSTPPTQACPDLSPYYPGPQTDWITLEQGLAVLMPGCLQSAQFFWLYGTAQLNSGNVAGAVEMLEWALLLEPDHGGAQVDYSQALFLQGQLFAALDLNRQLLSRPDLPQDLQPMLQERQQDWQSMTRQTAYQLDVLAGYDDNLNGAPDPSQITLTLSGESVILPLDEEFRPVSGAFMSLRLGVRHRQLTPRNQHNVSVDIRGRGSDDSGSNLLQVDTRYAFIRPGRERSWQLDTGVSHLFFGGSSLFTATDVTAQYLPGTRLLGCRPLVNIATQHQLFHEDSTLNAMESELGVGLNCPLNTRLGRQQLNTEISVLSNEDLKSGRPGGGRTGWQFTLDWQWQLAGGVLSSQISHTELNDREGYSPLLANGADRWLNRSFFAIQYRLPLRSNTSLLVNASYQDQRSNIELFRSQDTTVEIGFSHSF